MERFLMNKLVEWKDDRNRKPLIITGARQVGKTWLVREFGRRFFSDQIYINFERQHSLHDLMEKTVSPDSILEALSALYDRSIDPANTLIIFDEVQEEPRALTALKYFCEEKPEYAVIATGSFMGIALHKGTSFPVGKVNMITLYPMNYREFLCASGKEQLSEILAGGDIGMITSLKSMYIDLLRVYYVVGGMPAAVLNYLESHNYSRVRDEQRLLLDYYRMDLSKHADPRLAVRLNQVWDIVPSQLAKENKKFMFSLITKGARSKDYEMALEWLRDCGLIYIVHRVTKPGIPLKFYEDLSAFKIYMNDVGLLGCAGDLEPEAVIEGNRLFSEFKGAISEQYVLMQMISDMGIMPYYYSTENSRGEIDFITEKNGRLIPIEVKAEENLKARSLRALKEKYPDAEAIRISMSDYRKQDWLTNLPLYAFTTLFSAAVSGDE